MRFSDQILDDIRSRLPVSQVVGRRVSLRRQGREYAGLSPFKSEKTPSFFVNDHKGFYHCFASGEHGDIFTFVMKTEGLTFPEAVERLAGEAGVNLPKHDARDERRADERARLLALLDDSARFFEETLKGRLGAEARSYLDKRRLKPSTRAEFRIGFAPNSKSALREFLAGQGYSVNEMVMAGMLIAGDDIPVAYDRFRNRIMFPIRDPKGRVIAFGGRALDATAPAKYLNSPETPLFHKGATLFNIDLARVAAHDTQRIVAVEGYMDVISLAQAGIRDCVAPLGTAVTERQIELMWRLSSEPILCFDGDSAGRRAAHRAVDTALPLLKPGYSLRFAFIADGQDPDDLARDQGAEAVNGVLSRTEALASVLWEREWASGEWSTPERRAGLEAQFRAHTARIAHPVVRSHYEQDIRQRLFGAWRGASAGGRAQHAKVPYVDGKRGERDGRRWKAQSSALAPGAASPRAQAGTSLRNSALVAASSQLPRREALLVRTLLVHPWLFEQHAETVSALMLTSLPLMELRDAILATLSLDNSLDSQALRSQLTLAGLGTTISLVDRAVTHNCDRFARPESEPDEVEAGWRHTLALHQRQFELQKALDAALNEWHSEGSEEALARICELKRELERAEPGAEPAAA